MTGEPQKPNRGRRLWLVAGVLLSLTAFAAWRHWPSGRQTSAGTPPVSPSTEGYVGSEKCAACHAEIAETYKSHPMARSITLADASLQSEVTPENSRVLGYQRVYDVDIVDDMMRHHEKMFDAAGKLIYDQAVPMQYVVGSGRSGKSFIYRRGNSMFISPLSWYAREGNWGMSLGYAPDDELRFDRRVTERCLSCHAGRVAVAERGTNRYQAKPFFEMGVGCENCHGPGAKHVAIHEDLASADDGDPIVNPARLDTAARESVCNQCHLHAAVRVLRPGHSEFDFRPGQLLGDIWTVLDTDHLVAEDGRTPAISHVQQMRASRCYQESDGRLGCISCHDPHRLPSESEAAGFYRERCLKCHTDASCSASRDHRSTANDSCIACHMPKRDATNIAHVTQANHTIVRTVDLVRNDDVSSANADDAESLAFFDDTDLRLEVPERDRALGLGQWIYLAERKRPLPVRLAPFLEGVLKNFPDDGEILTRLGTKALDENRIGVARKYVEKAKDIPQAEENALTGLLKIHYLSGEWAKALKCADRLIEIDPGNARTHGMRAHLLGSLGRRDEGIEAALRGLELNPTLLPVRQWLADAYRDAGRIDEASEQSEILRRMREARPPNR